MNVLQVLPALNAGGVERTTIEMCEALSAAGHQAHVACAGGRMETLLAEAGGVLHRINIGSKNPLKLRSSTKALIDIIRQEKINIVHARSRAPGWPAHAAARAAGVPFVTTYHGIYNAKTRLKRRYNAVMARGDIIIANSEFTKSHIIQEHGTDPERIVVIPRGVDMAVFDPALINPGDVKKLKSDWGIAEGQTVVLLPGRLTRWKGQLVAIAALEKLNADCVLVLLGDPQGRQDYVDELNRDIETRQLSGRVFIPGHFDNVPLALSAADIVISTSTDPEAFGRVMAEAQAMKRPVVASAHGGSMETVIPGKSGQLVSPGEPDDLADAISEVLAWNDYDGDQVRRRIEENFSKRQLQEKTLAVYRSLVL